jgi:hypothetical protein
MVDVSYNDMALSVLESEAYILALEWPVPGAMLQRCNSSAYNRGVGCDGLCMGFIAAS